MTRIEKRQLQARSFPYLILDTTQHKHLAVEGTLNFEVLDDNDKVAERLGTTLLFMLNSFGIPTIHAGALYLDLQYVEVTVLHPEPHVATVKLWLVEQRRFNGEYISDGISDEQLKRECTEGLSQHLRFFNNRAQGSAKWLNFGAVQIEQVMRATKLQPGLIRRMEIAEAKWWEYLQRAGAAQGLPPQYDASENVSVTNAFLEALLPFQHSAPIKPYELLDLGAIPDGPEMVLMGLDAAPLFRISALKAADTGKRLPLSYIRYTETDRAFVISKHFDTVSQMAQGMTRKDLPPGVTGFESLDEFASFLARQAPLAKEG